MVRSGPHERPTRERLLDAARELFRQRGYAATGVKAILEAADAPYGSLYHHFPGGKEELGAAAVGAQGDAYRQLVESYFADDADLVATTAAFFDEGAAILESTAFADLCPVATVAGEVAGTSEPMRLAASEAFASWMRVLTDRAISAGIDPPRADALATELFCLVEGALLLGRVLRDGDPVRIAGRGAAALVERALAESRGLGGPPVVSPP